MSTRAQCARFRRLNWSRAVNKPGRDIFKGSSESRFREALTSWAMKSGWWTEDRSIEEQKWMQACGMQKQQLAGALGLLCKESTPEGMQTLLDVVQEFTTWCGMEINVNKTFWLVIDKDQKRRESMPAQDLRINVERLKMLDINDACRYLGNRGKGNGDMSATRKVVRGNEGGTWSNQKPPTDAQNFCRTLRTEKNRRLPVLGSPYWMVVEWVAGSAKNLGTSI